MVGSEQSNSLDAQKSNCKPMAFEQRKQHIVQGKQEFLKRKQQRLTLSVGHMPI